MATKPYLTLLKLSSLWLLSLLLLTSCSKKPPLTQTSPPQEVVKYLSWHLRSNLGEFNRFATDLATVDQLTHFRHQSDDAVKGLLEAGMWQNDSLSYQLHQRFSDTLTSLNVISVMKKGDSLVFHMAATEVGNISSQFNLIYNAIGISHYGHVSNSRKDRIPCDPQYLNSQYNTMNYGSCYADLADDWYLHHAYQHL